LIFESTLLSAITSLLKPPVLEAKERKHFVYITNILSAVFAVLKAAHQNGLQRVGTVGFTDPIRREYYERMRAISAELGIELRVFDSIEAAVAWMKRFVA
jgi:hypothetical protein